MLCAREVSHRSRLNRSVYFEGNYSGSILEGEKDYFPYRSTIGRTPYDQCEL